MSNLTRQQILQQLSRRHDPQIFLHKAEAPDEVVTQVPPAWWELCSLNTVDTEHLRELWSPMAQKLPYTLGEMLPRVKGLAVFTESDKPPALLYIFIVEDSDRLSFYVGYPPLDDSMLTPEQTTQWLAVRNKVQNFYQMHNGWADILMNAVGPMPIWKWYQIDPIELDLDADVLNALDFDPSRVLILYNNGAGECLAFLLPEAESTQEVRALTWSSMYPAKPRVDINFWSELDDYVQDALQEYTL